MHSSCSMRTPARTANRQPRRAPADRRAPASCPTLFQGSLDTTGSPLLMLSASKTGCEALAAWPAQSAWIDRLCKQHQKHRCNPELQIERPVGQERRWHSRLDLTSRTAGRTRNGVEFARVLSACDNAESKLCTCRDMQPFGFGIMPLHAWTSSELWTVSSVMGVRRLCVPHAQQPWDENDTSPNLTVT